MNNANRPPVTHAKEIAPYQMPAPSNTGNPKLDQKYQQQQQSSSITRTSSSRSYSKDRSKTTSAWPSKMPMTQENSR